MPRRSVRGSGAIGFSAGGSRSQASSWARFEACRLVGQGSGDVDGSRRRPRRRGRRCAPAKVVRLMRWVRFGRRARTGLRRRRSSSSFDAVDLVARARTGPTNSSWPALLGVAVSWRLGRLAAGSSTHSSNSSWGEGDRPACACWRGRGRRTRCTGPSRRPARRPRASRSWSRPGTASFLPLRAGTQKLWMTSRDVMSRSTGLAGRDDQLVGGDDVDLAVAVDVVVELPPPLLADHLDLHGVLGRPRRGRRW